MQDKEVAARMLAQAKKDVRDADERIHAAVSGIMR